MKLPLLFLLCLYVVELELDEDEVTICELVLFQFNLENLISNKEKFNLACSENLRFAFKVPTLTLNSIH